MVQSAVPPAVSIVRYKYFFTLVGLSSYKKKTYINIIDKQKSCLDQDCAVNLIKVLHARKKSEVEKRTSLLFHLKGFNLCLCIKITPFIILIRFTGMLMCHTIHHVDLVIADKRETFQSPSKLK